MLQKKLYNRGSLWYHILAKIVFWQIYVIKAKDNKSLELGGKNWLNVVINSEALAL